MNNTSAEPTTYLTGSQVCRTLGNISKVTLWRWRHRYPDFPAPSRINQSVNLWRREDVEAWIDAHRHGEVA